MATSSLLAATALQALATQASPELRPAAGCNAYIDPAGDAGVLGDPEPNSGGLDITGVSYRATPTMFSTVLRVPGLSAVPDRGTGDTWLSNFKVGKHTVQVKASRFSAIRDLDPVYDNGNVDEWLNSVFIDGTEFHEIFAGGEYDTRHHLVIISVDRRDLEKQLGASLGALAGVSAGSDARVYWARDQQVGAVELTADVATAPKGLAINATDNYCF